MGRSIPREKGARRPPIGRGPALALALAAAALTAAARPTGLAAQDAAQLRQRFLLPVPGTPEAALRPAWWTVPGASLATPTAYGADWGVVWMGGAFQARDRFSTGADAAVEGGFGLGDARRNVGLQVALVSFTTFREGFFTRGGVDLELHRYLGKGLAAGVGWESAVKWGFQDGGTSKYGVLSQWIQLAGSGRAFGSAVVSFGVGNGRFKSQADYVAGRNRLNPFGSVSVRVLPPVSLIGEWTGQNLFLAASVAPLRRIGLVTTVGLADVLRTSGDGVRFVVTGSLSADFRGR